MVIRPYTMTLVVIALTFLLTSVARGVEPLELTQTIPQTNAKLDTSYKLEAHPEGFQLEAKGSRIFTPAARTV